MSALADIVINDLTQTMKATLAPFIAKIENTNKHYQTLLDIMSHMPEYQQLVNENTQLKQEISSLNTVKRITISPWIQTNINNDICHLQDSLVDTRHSFINKSVEPFFRGANGVIDNLTDTIVETQNNVKSLGPVTLEPVTLEPVTLEIIPITTTNVDITEHIKQIYESVTLQEEHVEQIEAEEEEAEEEEEQVQQVKEEEESEEEEQVQQVEEEEEEEVEEEEEQVQQVEEEEECFIIEIDGVDYYTSNEESGDIYKIDSNDEVGDKVGSFVLGEPVML